MPAAAHDTGATTWLPCTDTGWNRAEVAAKVVTAAPKGKANDVTGDLKAKEPSAWAVDEGMEIGIGLAMLTTGDGASTVTEGTTKSLLAASAAVKLNAAAEVAVDVLLCGLFPKMDLFGAGWLKFSLKPDVVADGVTGKVNAEGLSAAVVVAGTLVEGALGVAKEKTGGVEMTEKVAALDSPLC